MFLPVLINVAVVIFVVSQQGNKKSGKNSDRHSHNVHPESCTEIAQDSASSCNQHKNIAENTASTQVKLVKDLDDATESCMEIPYASTASCVKGENIEENHVSTQVKIIKDSDNATESCTPESMEILYVSTASSVKRENIDENNTSSPVEPQKARDGSVDPNTAIDGDDRCLKGSKRKAIDSVPLQQEVGSVLMNIDATGSIARAISVTTTISDSGSCSGSGSLEESSNKKTRIAGSTSSGGNINPTDKPRVHDSHEGNKRASRRRRGTHKQSQRTGDAYTNVIQKSATTPNILPTCGGTSLSIDTTGTAIVKSLNVSPSPTPTSIPSPTSSMSTISTNSSTNSGLSSSSAKFTSACIRNSTMSDSVATITTTTTTTSSSSAVVQQTPLKKKDQGRAAGRGGKRGSQKKRTAPSTATGVNSTPSTPTGNHSTPSSSSSSSGKGQAKDMEQSQSPTSIISVSGGASRKLRQYSYKTTTMSVRTHKKQPQRDLSVTQLEQAMNALAL